MSEKQFELIQKLLDEKATSIYALQAKYHYVTGGRSQLPQITEMNGQQASWLIKELIAAPKKKTAEQVAHFENACNKYDQLIAWAKENGLKARSKMKKASVLKLASEAGLTVPAELI